MVSEQSPPGQRDKWGAKRRVALLMVGVALLVFGVDAVARVAVQTQVEGRLQTLVQSGERPDVKARGVLFLPQVIGGAYQEVAVTTRGVISGDLRLESVDAQLFDVRVPFHDVLTRDITAIGIARSAVRARLLYSDINAYLESTGQPLTLSRGPDGEVQVTGELIVAGQPVTASGKVSLSVEGGVVRATPQQIDTGDSTLDRATRLLLGDRLSFTLPLDELPYGQEITAATPVAEGIEVEARGTGIVLRQP